MIPIRDTIKSETTPYVNYALMAINIVVFFVQLTIESDLQEQALASTSSMLEARAQYQKLYLAWLSEWGFVPAEIGRGGVHEYKSMFTSMFMHGGWFHLGGNMLYLYIFGDNVEDRLGHFKYILYYLFCGLAAIGGQYVIAPDSTIPMIGASGAIAGALGGYLVLFPRSRVRTVVPIFFYISFIEIPAPFFLILWFIMQNLAPAAITSGKGGGIAYWAHIGGFVMGAAICWLFRKKLRPEKVTFIERPQRRSPWD